MYYKKELDQVLSTNIKLELYAYNKFKKSTIQNDDSTKTDVLINENNKESFGFLINGDQYLIEIEKNKQTNIYKPDDQSDEEKTLLNYDFIIKLKSTIMDQNDKPITQKEENFQRNMITGFDNIPIGLKYLIKNIKEKNLFADLKPTYEMLSEDQVNKIGGHHKQDGMFAETKDAKIIDNPTFIPNEALLKEVFLKNKKEKIDINFKNMIELNSIGNNSKNRNYVLNKLNRYTNAALPEMVYGLMNSKKILETFENKNEIKEIKNKNVRRNKFR